MPAPQGTLLATVWQSLDDTLRGHSPPTLNFLLAATGLCVFAYAVGLATYRLFLSPIAGIPGPKLAAISFWYEIYYDVWLGGRYYSKIEEMHKVYGPIVRINPYEVHFNDPDFIDSIFPGPARKTNKYFFTGQRTGTQNSIVATIDHDVHRKRRGPISVYFSTASIRRLEPLMQEHLAKLLSRMEEAGRRGEVLPMHYVFRAATSDMITKYAFGDSFHFLDRKDFAMPYMESTNVFSMLNHTFCHFPWVGALLAWAPPWAVKALIPSLAEMWDKQLMWIERVQQLRQSKKADSERVKSTIFEGILASSSIPEEEKTDARLAHEAQLIVFAGEDTTAHTLQAALYELLANPSEFAKVKAEVVSAIPDPDQIPAFSQVDNLPYLNAVIQETIRVHPGVVSRLPRVSPQSAIVYTDKQRGKEYIIPPGTSTNMTAQIAHMNPDVFQDPYEFRPQRWLDNPRIDRAFIGFARGTRNCIGMALARRELSLFLAAIVRKYDIYRGQHDCPTLELFKTSRARDIDLSRDYILPFPTKGSHGLRVKVRN
ncbi:cytochrome p450 [Hirsutella rhossiliensis]|uniref:Cytochrome p450 domain-containing protein n=1 Tax=Hirsutella rhossiliensis TaxID=111463 RepID=A0A9P8MLW0_9HYPO|nr:cytochrome p450 domain-containing protein [Hirsutella rhossiliensis]KAH0957414.1 cytochrome p450 domain-containing protein [Hirsutella rhossiliensis]